jgi:hypothetical protein
MGHQRALIERMHSERIATLKADEDLAEVALSFQVVSDREGRMATASWFGTVCA